jgi:hypothetical protein
MRTTGLSILVLILAQMSIRAITRLVAFLTFWDPEGRGRSASALAWFKLRIIRRQGWPAELLQFPSKLGFSELPGVVCIRRHDELLQQLERGVGHPLPITK